MTIKSSGSLAVSEIVTEFGGNTPHSFSEYYRGGSYVSSGITNPNGIPTSGPLAVSTFYGAAKKLSLSYVVGIDRVDLNIHAEAVAAGWNYVLPFDLVVTIQPGIYLGSSSTSTYALDTGFGYPAGTTITIINNGYILGKGGSGGGGGNSGSPGDPGGTPGGPAFLAQTQITLINNGVIGGGGGGGGGGRGGQMESGGPYYGGGGGGGGQGFLVSAGGAGGETGGFGTDGIAGTGGTQTTSGSGGYGQMGSGGSGGSLGTAGGSGTATQAGNYANYGPYDGYAAGAAVVGTSNITWGSTGTIYGTIS